MLDPGPESLMPISKTDDELEEEEDHDFSEIERYGIVEVAGDDPFGRKVIIVSACKLPSNKEIDHQLLLRYIFMLYAC